MNIQAALQSIWYVAQNSESILWKNIPIFMQFERIYRLKIKDWHAFIFRSKWLASSCIFK